MRRQTTELRSQGTRIRPRDESRGALAKRSRLRRLALESLEARQLLATNPLPGVTTHAAASAGFAATTINDSQPFIAVDPLDSNKLVTVFTDRDTSSGTTLFSARVTFSTDGGATWNIAAAQPNLSGDPTSTTGARLIDTAEGVGFDRNGNFFVGVLETNNSNAGDVVVDKYNFSGGAPTAISIGGFGFNDVYDWNQTVTNASAQPTVLNFSMAVDSNVAAYVDPSTGAAQSDSNSGAVYIAWTLNTPPPQGVTFWNPDTIQVIASPDGVTWPAYDFTGDNGNGTMLVSQGNFNGTPRFTAPQIAVAQGKAGGTDGGNISVIFDDFASGSNFNPPVDLIDYSRLSFGLSAAKGAFVLTSLTAPGGTQIATTTVRGALGAPYPLSTPSSPLGIGPGAQIAIDNSLGSFSGHEGRIYVTYVNRSTAAGNPADNTDIDLIHLDEGSTTWSAPTVVNSDLGQVDGHSAGDNGIQGRPQYEPAIAVDNSTGTLVMSWLDVRDDASLQRYADYLTTSTDGGSTFSPQTFADQPNLVTDATTESAFVAGPYSGDESGGNPNAETSRAFGINQGLAVSNGVIHPAWSTTIKSGLTSTRLTIDTARVTMPAGPRITSGTSGSSGATSLSSFTVTFDRPVAVNSFNNPNQVTVQYLNAMTGLTTSSNPSAGNFDPNLAIASIAPVATQGAQNLEATQFRITFAHTQTGVGTYSYAVSATALSTPTSQFPSGTTVQDLVRTAGPTTLVSDPAGTAAIVSAVVGGTPSPTLPDPITDSAASTSTTTSTIIVSGAVNGNFVANVVPDIFISYPDDSKLKVTLTSPDGVAVTLVAAGEASGANFTNTAFSDTAPQALSSGTAPYTGLFLPAQALSAFANGAINGPWTLTITDSGNSGLVGSLTTWSLNITPQIPAAVTTGPPTPAPATIRDAPPATSTSTSVRAVSGAPPADVAQTVTVSNLTISYPSPPSPLTVELTSPGGQTVVLATGVGSLSNASFSTNAFTGGPINGNWTLSIVDANNGGLVGSLANWSLGINAARLVSSTQSTGDLMDQNANGVGGQAVDYFANPAPVTPTANPFTAPYDTATLPIVIGGPRAVSTFVGGTIADTRPTTASTVAVSGAPAGDTVQSVTVSGLSLSYPNDANLVLTLMAPNGIGVVLASGLAGANFSGTAFSDAAATPIASGAAPYRGTFKPTSPLSGLAGAPVNGNWTLTVTDKATGGNLGTLTGWTLSIVPTTPAPAIAFAAPTLLPALIADTPPATSSQITAAGAPVGDTVQSVTVSGLSLSYPNDANLVLKLTAPNGASTTLATGLTGANFSGTTFSDAAAQAISAGTAPYTGTFKPTSPLSALAGAPVNGNWTLTVTDTATGTSVGTLTGWTLNIVPTTAAPALAFTPPTLIGAADPTTSAQAGKNLVLNSTANSIDVTFDVPMNPATFTASQVLTMTGPTGAISGPFIVTPDPQPGESTIFPKTFKITFPIQQLSGTYAFTFGAGLQSSTGIPVDTNQNAGVDLLFSNATGIIPAGPSTFTGQQAIGQSWAITPSAPLVTTITIPAGDNSLIQDFSLALNISYPNDPDLTATLTTPIIDPVTQRPFTVLLFSGNGAASGSKANFTNTVFNDGAATLIGNGAPPFFGQFKPLQSLLVDGHLLGANEAGTYTLTITDAGTSSGTFNGWSITTTPQTTTNTGLGEPVADQTTASFRIFTMDPTNPLSSNTWTAVGPASNNGGGNSGRVSAIAVDPSDPSGNTVYVTGASGGIWKTTNFLTTAGGGPTYTLLTGDSEGNALNIGSIAVFARNNNPNQSIIVAGTGEGNTAQPGVQGSSTVGTSAGVGFLISYDGGKTWTLDDSLVNYDASGTEIPEATRGHEFVGTTTFKVLIDPNPTASGNVIIYAALGGGQSGTVGVGGIYRSLDSGHTWQLMRSGFATSVVFDPNSGTLNAVSNPTGNLRVVYGAFLGDGVYLSPNQGQTWNKMTGGAGDPLLQNIFQGKATPVPVGAPPLTPNGGGGRIVLAKPALTGNALLDAEYETWLYAAVVTPAGAFNGLFVTKDNGLNWTDALLPNALPASGTSAQGLDPSNNIGLANYNITGGQGNYDFALAVDPNDPNVVYIGGSADFGPTTMIRVDVTRLSDPYSVYSSTETTGGQILQNTTTPVTIKDPTNLVLTGLDPLSNPFTNLYRNPTNIFASDSTVFVHDTGSLSNDGSGAWWTPFDGFIGGTDVHVIVPMVDPVTGKTRLLVGYDQGIATAVDNNGTFLTSIGNQPVPFGVTNGNLQITQFYNGAAQPSALAAQIAGALFYGEAQDDGFPTSNAGVLSNGNIGWVGSTGDGTDVATDATGTGTSYQSVWPCCNTVGPSEFFQVDGIGRTFGLLQSASAPPTGSLPGSPDPQWPAGPSSNFAVNPIDNQEMIIASLVGRLFETEDQGVIWTELAEPTIFDSTTIPALAYGAPDPNGPGVKGALDNYMLVGTSGGHIYATFTGGGNGAGNTNAWINISAGLSDNAPIQRIVTDPTRGTHDAYAISADGVYYNADTSAATTTWVNITGDLFKQTATPFGDAALTRQQLLDLGGLAADWRYVIPFDPKNPSKGTHPMLYVAGVGGVFRSTNNGTNWTAFPDQTLATPVPDGNLPSATVSDLDMVLGNVDPTTGHPTVSTGPNLLLATTYGSGSYGIRLAPIIFNDATNKVTESQNSAGVLTFSGLSEQSAFGNAVAVTVEDVTDPANPIFLGGYDSTDGNPTATSPTFNMPGNQTDVNGKFGVTGTYPAAPANNPFLFDGVRTIAVFATDGSGTRGNVVTFQITNNLPTPAAPVFLNQNGSPPPLTNGLIAGGIVITNSTAPIFGVVLPGSGITASVSLIRIDSQGNKTTVNQATITGAGTIADPTNSLALGTYTYEVQYTVTIDGNLTNSPPSAATTVKVVAAETIGLLIGDDSGTKGDGITNVKQPHFVGTAVPNAANDANLSVNLVVVAAPAGSGIAVGTVLGTIVDPSNGQYVTQSSTKLPDGTYSLAIQAKDAAGDSLQSAPLVLTISTSGPKVTPTLALLAASDVPANNPNATVVRRPSVFGVTDPGASVNIFGSINGGPLVLLAQTTAQSFANNGHPAGYFQTQLLSNLGDGQVKLFAFAANAAGNTNPNPGMLNLRITSVTGDYTGAGRAVLATYTPANGSFTFGRVGNSTVFLSSFGLANVDIPVPGDYNGDGQTDPAIYRPTNGFWAIDENSQVPNGQAPFAVFIPPIVAPGPNVAPAPADFDVDGQTDPAVFSINSSGFGIFTILHNQIVPGTISAVQSVAWGLSGDTPVSADFDGAGSAQVAVYRPSTGAWYVRSSGTGGGAATPAGRQEPALFVTAFKPGDVPDAADYDGIGRIEPAIYRPSTETFYIYNPITKTTRSVVMPNIQQNSGQLVMPASADFTGDGKADPAIFNQATATWEYQNSATGQFALPTFALTLNDIALTAPEQYRAAADVAAQPAFRTAGAFLAVAPGSTGSGSSTSSSSGQVAKAAVVVGAPIPNGSTSTGKTSTLPAVPVATPPPIILVNSGSSTGRPAQDATDSAIDSLGQSYNGLFI